VECQFCIEFSAPDIAERVITEIDGWVLFPDIGGFVPGYSLLMPVRHVDAAADVGDDLNGLEKVAEDMRALVAARFGPTIIAEHGSRGCDLGAGCCTHAHLHLIPVPDPEQVLRAYVAKGGPGTRLNKLSELPSAVDSAYMYLSVAPGDHLVWPAQGFERQYVRRVCAALHGCGDAFDWREHPQVENQRETLRELRLQLG
jgi:diadenosine tetraphosphate (Ap4A) HIT family hydrolase